MQHCVDPAQQGMWVGGHKVRLNQFKLRMPRYANQMGSLQRWVVVIREAVHPSDAMAVE
jgi:hypothetical protein